VQYDTHPYTLGWVSQGMESKVTNQWKFKFSIDASFIDEVVVDVIPLDVCGIIFGIQYLHGQYVVLDRGKMNIVWINMEVCYSEFT
jgi:hypothetical protein